MLPRATIWQFATRDGDIDVMPRGRRVDIEDVAALTDTSPGA